MKRPGVGSFLLSITIPIIGPNTLSLSIPNELNEGKKQTNKIYKEPKLMDFPLITHNTNTNTIPMTLYFIFSILLHCIAKKDATVRLDLDRVRTQSTGSHILHFISQVRPAGHIYFYCFVDLLNLWSIPQKSGLE